MIKLTTEQILALAQFDPDMLPDTVRTAFGVLMSNYGEQLATYTAEQVYLELQREQEVPGDAS